MKNEAILYGYKNKKNGKMYIGFHKTDDKDDLYSSSSTSPYFRIDWNRGDLDKFVLAEGSVSEMINLEYAVLTKFDAKNNKDFYNKSNGGGDGVDKTYKVDAKLLKKAVDWVNGKVTKEKKKVGVFNKLKMQKLAQAIKDGDRDIVSLSVQQLYTLHRNQVRMQSIDHEHVEELVVAFSDPATAQNYLTPVIVLVDKDGNMLKLLDGNHRVEAAHKSKWIELPAIAITEKEFEYNNYNQEFFGVLMNDQPYKVLGNNDDDLTKQLMSLSSLHPELQINDPAFISLAKDMFGGKNGLWHSSKITKRCQKLADVAEEEKLKQGSNFISYSYTQLDKLKKELIKNNPDTAIILQGSDSICNAGIGGILNAMTTAGLNKGLILVHYPKYQMYQDREKHYQQFKQIQKLLKSDTEITLKFLSPFKLNKVMNGLPTKTESS